MLPLLVQESIPVLYGQRKTDSPESMSIWQFRTLLKGTTADSYSAMNIPAFILYSNTEVDNGFGERHISKRKIK